MRKRRRNRKKRFCRKMKVALCHISKSVCKLRRARELTCKEWVEDELTHAIGTLRDVRRQLARVRSRQCTRPVCRCHC